jgi:hypothetical protein
LRVPVILDRPPQAPPPTLPAAEPKRPWWKRYFPWTSPQTRIAGPTDDGELLLDNRTDDTWALHLGYRALGPIAPHTRQHVRVVKSGMLTARPAAAPAGADYLIASLHPHVHTVQIRHSVVQGVSVYDLHLIGGEEAARPKPE